MRNGTMPIQHQPSKVSNSSTPGINGRIESARTGQWANSRSCQRMVRRQGVLGSGQGLWDVWFSTGATFNPQPSANVAAVIVLALDSRNSRLLSITPTIADHSDWIGASTAVSYQIIRVDLSR